MDTIKKQFDVEVFEPAAQPTGITVLLPGTRTKLSEYDSTKGVLLEESQLVIGYKNVNPFRKSHNRMAEDVRDVVAAVQQLEQFLSLSDVKYNIVGHSLGGKVALLVAAKFDVERVAALVALDPVDAKPKEIITGITPLEPAVATIHLTRAEEGGKWQVLMPPQSPERNSATAIRDAYPKKVDSYTFHGGAGHMAYTDSGNGGNYLFGGGTKENNDAALVSAHSLIRKISKIPSAPVSPRRVAELVV